MRRVFFASQFDRLRPEFSHRRKFFSPEKLSMASFGRNGMRVFAVLHGGGLSYYGKPTGRLPRGKFLFDKNSAVGSHPNGHVVATHELHANAYLHFEGHSDGDWCVHLPAPHIARVVCITQAAISACAQVAPRNYRSMSRGRLVGRAAGAAGWWGLQLLRLLEATGESVYCGL